MQRDIDLQHSAASMISVRITQLSNTKYFRSTLSAALQQAKILSQTHISLMRQYKDCGLVPVHEVITANYVSLGLIAITTTMHLHRLCDLCIEAVQSCQDE